MMASERRSREDWLQDIVLWGERLAEHVLGVSQQQFTSDRKTQDAVVRCIAAIGEASIQLMRTAPGIDIVHPELQLKQAYATRSKLAHGYYNTDYDIVWVTATKSVPSLLEAARRLVAKQAR